MASIYDEICSREEEATKRVSESYSSRNDKSKFDNYFNSNLPFEIWAQAEGDHTIDILPWLAGKNYPKQKEGSVQHVLDLWVHTKIGYQKNSYVCLQMNYGKACPICEKIEKFTQQDGYDEDFVYTISPKRRCAYYVLVWDTKSDERKGVQVWETSHWFSEKHIAAVARQARTGGMVNFAHPINGKTIEFIQTKTARGFEVSGFKLVPRQFPGGEEYEIPRDIIESLEPLDNFIQILSYDEMSKITIGAANPKEKDNDNGESEHSSRGRMGSRGGSSRGDSDGRSRFVSSRRSANRSDNDRSDRSFVRGDSNRSGRSDEAASNDHSRSRIGGGAERGRGRGDQGQLQNSEGRSQLSSRRSANDSVDERNSRRKEQDDQYVDDQDYDDDIPF